MTVKPQLNCVVVHAIISDTLPPMVDSAKTGGKPAAMEKKDNDRGRPAMVAALAHRIGRRKARWESTTFVKDGSQLELHRTSSSGVMQQFVDDAPGGVAVPQRRGCAEAFRCGEQLDDIVA